VKTKTLKSLPILIPFLYAAVLSFSVSNTLFWADDARQLSYIRELPSFWNAFGPDSFHLFRPVKNLLWLLFSALEPLGLEFAHAITIVIGALSFFPVYAAFRRILGSKDKGLAAASVWLFSPTLVSSAAWLSCVNIQVMAAFAAGTIALHDSAWDAGSFRPLRIGLAGLCLLLALVSYECAVAVLPILLAFDFFLRPGRIRTRSAGLAYCAYAAVLALYFLLRTASGATGQMSGIWSEATRWHLMVSSPYFTAQHFASWFWPFGRFTVLGGYAWGDVPIWMLVATAIVFLSVFVAAIALRKRFPVLSFSVFFALLGFAPVSNCLGFGNGPYGDYYLTLASMGLSVGCVEGVCLLFRIQGTWRGAALLAAVLFSISRIAGVFEATRWAKLWSRSELAFEESVRNMPQVASNKFVFIQFLSDLGRDEEALELGRQIEEAVGPDSSTMETTYLIRALHAINVTHDPDAAFEALEKCRSVGIGRIAPEQIQFYRGCAFEDLLGDEISAESEYESALAGPWDFSLVPCADRLARLKALRGERRKAIELWERAINLDPRNATVLLNLSIAFREEGDIARSNELQARARAILEKGEGMQDAAHD
jgi:hypothetical protein